MAHSASSTQDNMAMPVYYPLNFDLWTLFEEVDAEMKTQIELVHIFGEATELLSAYFVTCDDVVYGVGRNDFGRLGIGELHPGVIEQPREIEHLTGKRVTSFACGAMHTLALTEAGEVFSWGFNMLGPLGHGTIINRDSPGLVLLPQGVKIKAIGAKCSYSVAITTDNEVLHWGDIMSTECSCQNMPIPLEFPEPISFRQLACATSHVCLLTSDSKVYLWATYHGDGNPDALHPTPPQLITTKEHKNITSIACSREVTVALNENGRIYVLLSPTPLDIIIEAQKTLPVMEIAGSPFSDTPIVFRMGDEGFIRIFPPYYPTDSDSYYCSDSMKNIQCAFHGMATPQVCRRKIDELDSRLHRIQGPERNIGITLYNVQEHSDLTVLLSDGEVYVHKLILVSFCEHFKSMLLGPWAKQDTNEAKVLDMKRYNPRAFRAFLKFLYTGGLDLMQGEDLIDLYDISKSYLEDELVSMCSKMFVKIIKPNSVAYLYKKAADDKCEELVRHLESFTTSCLEQVILSEAFENLDANLAKRLLMIKNGRTIVTYQVGNSDGAPICRLAGVWRSTSCAVHCADALCARWSCPSECCFTVTGKTRLHVVDSRTMKDVTCFNMSNSGVTKTLCHAHSLKHMNVVAVGTNLEKLLLVDLRSGARMTSHGDVRIIRGLSWSPLDDQALVTATDQSLQLWDVRQMSGPTGDFDSCPMSDRILPQIAFWGRDRVLTMVSRSLISVHDLKSRRMLRLESHLQLRGYHHQEGAFRFAVNDDGDLLYCPSGNKVSVIDLNSGNLLCSLSGHQHPIISVFFNPNLNMIYSFSCNESYVWSSGL